MSNEDTYIPVLPEWVGGASKNAGYAPPDIGSQATQLNYLQDAMGTGQNPLMLWLAGQMDAGSLQSTYEDDEVIPGVTAGRDFLVNAVNMSPNSTEGLIAEHILNGGSPIEAVKLAEQAGLIKPSMRDSYTNGQKVGQEPDTSERDYYMKWAQDAQNRLLQDKEEQRTPGKEILHPFVQEMINAGFSDPRQEYSPDYLNPDLARMDDKVASQEGPLADALKQRDAMSKYVASQRQPQGGTAPQGVEEERYNAQPAWMGHQPASKPRPNQPLLDSHGQPTFPALSMGGMGPGAQMARMDLSGAPAQRAMQAMQGLNVNTGDAFDAANMFEARMAGGYKNDTNRAQLAKRAEGVGRKAQQLNMRHAHDKNTSSLERIKATAVSNYLRSQGRSPAKDQYAAAMQELQRRLGQV